MFCKNCGSEIDDKAYVCPHCGVKVQDEVVEDSGSKIGWGILSFIIPLVGLILYLVWKTERPATAKLCGKCALIAVIIEVAITILYAIVAGILIAAASSNMTAILPALL